MQYLRVLRAGHWFTPERQALDAEADAVQQRVSGVVRLKLFEGTCAVGGVDVSPLAGRPSPRQDATDDDDMTNLWSGRFDTAPDAAAFEFGASFRFDRRLFEDDVTGSLAWARRLRAAGVLPRTRPRRSRPTLEAHARAGRSDPAVRLGDDEDVHSFVERLLVERLGDAGRRLHTGRSRNEQVSLDLRLYLRRRIPLLQRAVASVVDALAARPRRPATR